MKKIILIFYATLLTNSLFSQNYSFSINKIGVGEQNLIFIPGFACSGEVWNETIEALISNYTCYVLTMPGFAGVPVEENPSFENWVKQIATFIENEKIGNPIIIGHSMGGGLALAIASDYPKLLNKIVIVDGLPCLSAITNTGFQSNPENDCSALVNQITNLSEKQFLQMQKIGIVNLTNDVSKFEKIIDWSMKSDRKTFAKIFCDFSNTDLREKIINIKVPSLILLEPNFKKIESEIIDQFENLTNYKINYANKGLHFVMYDDYEWFIEQLSQFIEEK